MKQMTFNSFLTNQSKQGTFLLHLLAYKLYIKQQMNNLAQLKSRQFHRHSTIEPIARTNSFQTIDLKHRDFRTTKIKPSQSIQNQYDLANIVNQILQSKPKTAPRSQTKQFTRSKRSETQSNNQTKIPNIISKTNPVSIIDILRGKRQKVPQLEDLDFQKQSVIKYDRNCFQSEKDNTKSENHKTSRNVQSDNHCTVSFQTIKFPIGVCKASFPNKVQEIFRINQENKFKQEQRKLITKTKTQHQFLPKSKISIKNIDKYVNIEGHGQSYKKQYKHNYDIKNEIKLNHLINKSKDANVTIENCEKKSKKPLIQLKIPDYIKASLESYKRGSSQTKHNKDTQLYLNREDVQQQEQTKQNAILTNDLQQQQLEQEQQNFLQNFKIAQKLSEDNLIGGKLQLYQKAPKSIKQLEKIKLIHQNEIEPQQDKKYKIFRPANRIKSKAKYIQDEWNQKICGWEGDIPVPQSIVFPQ